MEDQRIQHGGPTVVFKVEPPNLCCPFPSPKWLQTEQQTCAYMYIYMHKIILSMKDLCLALLRQPFHKHYSGLPPGWAGPSQVGQIQLRISAITLWFPAPLVSQQAAPTAQVHPWLVHCSQRGLATPTV